MYSTSAYDHDDLEEKLHDPTAAPIYLPFQFLKEITCNFSDQKVLGRGLHGIVYKGVLRSGKIIAVKKIHDINLLNDDQFQREVCYLMGIRNQHVVQLVGYCAESRLEVTPDPNAGPGKKFVMAHIPTRLLCFEYLCRESLDKHLSEGVSSLDWSTRFKIIKGICSGLKFLHEKRIVHLDLKPQNIVMDATMTPKIADFGLSRLLGTGKSRTTVLENPAGTRGYMAPEYYFHGVVSAEADIFSFGVIIIEIITGCREYPLTRQLDQHIGSDEDDEIVRQQYIRRVLETWRNILPNIYTKQVKQCMTIALRCVDQRSRRPKAEKIFQILCYQAELARNAPHTESVQPTWMLAFQTPPKLPIFRGSKIEGASGCPLEIILLDACTGSPAALPQTLYLELVPLIGDFPLGGREDWSNMEFQTNIAKERAGRPPLLMGDVRLTMRDGRATVGELEFTDISYTVASRTFRIGVRVVPGSFHGNRVREAITDAFAVQDQRVGLHRKLYPPVLGSEVWRLEHINKDGEFHRTLAQHHINTVQDFVRMLVVKPGDLLRILLSQGMTTIMWETTTNHARTCLPGEKVYTYMALYGAIYVDSLFNLLRFDYSGVQLPLNNQLNPVLTAYLHNLILEAYENRDNLHEVDASMINGNVSLLPAGAPGMALRAPTRADTILWHQSSQGTQF